MMTAAVKIAQKAFVKPDEIAIEPPIAKSAR